ncbi:MAG: PAS domain S-box protein, partial [Chitinophagaceae bacterium]|nr:PAS domain S-box protein [Chitinophagaceae bacterium]
IEVGTFKFLDVNEMAIQKYGYSREEFLSMTAEDIRPVNTRDSFRRENNPNIKQLNDGYRGVWQHQKKDGSLIWVEIIAHHIQFEGKKSRLILANDITEKKEAQDLLRSNEKRYRETLDNMLEGIQILDFEWRYLYVNNAVVKQARRKREELIGFSIFDIYPNIEDTELHAVFQRCFKDRTPQHLENKFVYPDGTTSWFELSFQPIPEGVFVLSVDITERVNAINALKEERDKLASIALTSPGLIYSFRLERENKMSFVYGSNAFLEIFGYSPEVINAGFEDFLKESCPEDRLELVNSIIKSAKYLEPYQKEFRYHHPVKGLRWLKAHSLPIRENKQSIIWHGIIMDNTESKNQEEKILEQGAQLQTLSNNLPGVMIFQLIGATDGTREFTMVSSEVTRLTGRTPEEVIKDPSILYDMILEEDRPAFIQQELDSYEKMVPFRIEVRARSKFHGVRWLYIVSTPRKLNDGRIAWDGFHIDITERKLAEERINNINAELEEKVRIRTRQLQKTNEELESFAYSVSHDLRAPLRGINGFADILQEDYATQLDDEAKRITRIIKENTVRMGNLIDDLLSFSRLGRQELEKVRFDTREMIYQLIASMEQKTETNRVSYDIQDLHSSYGDITSLRQVWINLIGNAIKYSRGNPQPTIQIGAYKENGETVFYVKDNGVGFDMKYVNKLFKVFQRLHTTEEFEGTGVGLAIVEKIINKHGGRVWATSAENAGACFYFTLPELDDKQLENITPPKSNRS